jgi:hypothetical protein
MFRKKPEENLIIEFSVDEHVDFIDLPKPSTKYLPGWYSKLERYIGGAPDTEVGALPNKAVKLCVPYRDALTFGYTIELWTDVQIDTTSQSEYPPIGQTFPFPPAVQVRNPNLSKGIPTPMGCGDHHFIWQLPFNFRTPPGYSLYFTHPINRYDLPFITLTGVIDSDTPMAKGNYPFFLKEGFKGVIEAGTPIGQFFPFKRENWKLERNADLEKLATRETFLAMRNVRGGYYEKNVWNRKHFE